MNLYILKTVIEEKLFDVPTGVPRRIETGCGLNDATRFQSIQLDGYDFELQVVPAAED